MPFDQVFFRLMPLEQEGVRAIADRYVPPPKDGQPTPIPPTLWRPWQSGAWVTPTAMCGLMTPLWTEVQIKYWKDANLHGDAVLEMGRRLSVAPCSPFAFTTHPYVIGIAAPGSEKDWKSAFRAGVQL